MSKHGTGANIKVRLYMEGRLLENAFSSMNVSGNTGSPAVAQLELVPTNAIKHILPGTWVHIFTTDPWDQNPAGDLSDFKLLFEGVVVSRGFVRRDGGRAFTVTCADPSVYWAEARQFWLNIASANGGMVDQILTAQSGGYSRFKTINASGVFGIVNAALGGAKDQPEERFMDTMISAIDDVGNVNPFYANLRNRLRLTDRIIRGPAGKTSKLFELAMFSDFIDGLAGRTGGQTSLADMVNQLLSAIMHEWVSVLAPPYLKTRIFMRDAYGNVKRTKTTVERNVEGIRKVDLFEYETATDNIIGSIIFKPHLYTLSPPTCNVLFPNMYDQLSFQESFLQEPTRLQMQPQMPTIIAGQTKNVLAAIRLFRPTELEIFQAMIRDPSRETIKTRTPDGHYTDTRGQTATFTDYDWATNEERIRGIVYNFINLAPAPSTLTMTSPGKRTPDGARKGGVPRYLQNVASYEYYKARFVSRQTSISGPYNMRPVVGFSMLALDDSAANMNMVSYLEGISHSIDSRGTAVTTYTISHPRLTDEVDLNRPKFTKAKQGQEIDLDLARDEDGRFRFEKLFDGVHQAPIPEWFDDSYRTLEGLDLQYREWFGKTVGVVEKILFTKPTDKEEAEMAAQATARAAALTTLLETNPKATEDDLPAALKDKQVSTNNQASLNEAVEALNHLYARARDTGHEFALASARTARTFTTIDQAFRFVGAAPLELSDLSEPSDSESGLDLKRTGRFTIRPAAGRVIDYRTARLDRFVGDVSVGSGYTGVSETGLTVAQAAAVDAAVGLVGGTLPSAAAQASNRMSGAFPIFDTEIHQGDAAINAEARAALREGTARAPSVYPRYDGRPLMHDFEYRLWNESLALAKYGPDGERIADAAATADHVVAGAGETRAVTPDEKSTKVQEGKATTAKRKQEEKDLTKKGRGRVKEPNMSPADQAPTGDGLDQEQRKPLVQPLSEKQVIDLRRSVIAAYQEELASSRGFTG